jgi:PAS domain S-box-containing protein
MGTPRRDRKPADALEQFRNLQQKGAGEDAVAKLFHELKVHQEELSAQNHQLIETQNALEESRDRYVDLYDFAPIGYMTINPSGVIREINLTGATLLGRERGNVIGLPFNSFVVSDHKPVFSDHLRHCQHIEHGSATIELTLTVGQPPTSVQLVTRRHSGHTSTEPVFLTAIINVTSRRKLEHERREAEDARDKLSRDREFARARADAKDHFLATLSHELRTPLTPIVATMSDSRLISLAPEPLRTALHTARRNLDLEVRLIDDLLDLTRISRGRLQLTHERINLHLVIQEVIDMLHVETQRRRITVVTALDAPEHSVVGDPVRLRQVFWNLFGNATKFTNAGGAVTIASAAGEGAAIRVTVSDTGIGMERDVVNSINVADEAAGHAPIQSSSGLGLGLAICRGVVTAHGGTLRATSSGPGSGSTFVLEFPTAPRQDDADRSSASAQPPRDRPTSRLRILLVEDHQDSADMLSQLLTLHDYDVVVERTVEGALAAASREFDVLISDIRLPDGSGLELMHRLRANRNIRGVAISGFGTEDDRQRSLDAGYGTHLTKPVDFNRLIEAIEQISGRNEGDA